MLNELNGKKVLLTGATGLIGSSIVKVLENYNVKIVAVVRNIEKAKKILGKYTNIDYLNYDIVDIPIENMKIDYVIPRRQILLVNHLLMNQLKLL